MAASGKSGVKSMKTLLRKIGSHHLRFEELSTILVEAEVTQAVGLFRCSSIGQQPYFDPWAFSHWEAPTNSAN